MGVNWRMKSGEFPPQAMPTDPLAAPAAACVQTHADTSAARCATISATAYRALLSPDPPSIAAIVASRPRARNSSVLNGRGGHRILEPTPKSNAISYP